jgi:hypothetical protein
MALAVHSNASYLSKPKAQSRSGGHFFLSSDAIVPPNNGAILNKAHIINSLSAKSILAGEKLVAMYSISR